ncbi:unnamed protein product [Urochloa humidicola]
MASSSVSPSSPNPVGLWFGQISSGLQSRCQQGERAKNGAGGSMEAKQASRAADAAGTKDGEPARRMCRRDAMPEATVYLLLDRFAPS